MTREEAIEIVKTQYSHDHVMKTALGMLIPELRESEDERTRKRAIAILKQQRDYWSYDGPIDKFPPATPRKDLVDAIDVALSYLEKQKEQKNEFHLPPDFGMAYYNPKPIKQKEQKPTEWSEEDERIRQGLIKMYKNEHLVSVPIGVHAKDIIRFLENLRPSWKPSEEQMKALNAMNCYGELSYQGQQQLLIDLYQQLKKL